MKKNPIQQDERWAQLALKGIRRLFPNKIAYRLETEADLRSPRQQTPIFYGCFDWHSAVHSHWALVRLLKEYPEAVYQKDVRSLLAEQFTAAKVATELAWLKRHPSFERPYGLSWLLLLIAELQGSPDHELQDYAGILSPLQRVARDNLLAGFDALPFPIRTGTHQQTAFSLGLAWEAAKLQRDDGTADHLAELAKRFFPVCRSECLASEPSGHDFLSPFLAEADVMSRLLSAGEFIQWWRMPEQLLTMQPVEVADPEDGHLVHFAGLNLSRSWMLDAIASKAGTYREAILALAGAHREKGLSQIKDDSYAGSHWLGTFDVYIMHRTNA